MNYKLKNINQKPALILALDIPTFKKAKEIVIKMYPLVRIFKVGPILFTGSGPAIIDFINKKGGEVFLDLKFHDIPNTVAEAARQVTRLGVKMFTLHISGGREMLQKACLAVNEESKKLRISRPLLIGITVLTSQKVAGRQVLDLAIEGISGGLDGVVCSVKEAKMLREKIKKDFLIVTPGIRPAETASGDQVRVATPEDAVKAGSDYLVVGRPILEASDPLKAAETIQQVLNTML
jgi:orotidine-5'-phosphate decarboxylase